MFQMAHISMSQDIGKYKKTGEETDNLGFSKVFSNITNGCNLMSCLCVSLVHVLVKLFCKAAFSALSLLNSASEPESWPPSFVVTCLWSFSLSSFNWISINKKIEVHACVT